MGSVIPFRDPEAPLVGKARDIALQALRDALPPFASRVIAKAFSETAHLSPNSGELGVEDVLPLSLKRFAANWGSHLRRRCPMASTKLIRIHPSELKGVGPVHDHASWVEGACMVLELFDAAEANVDDRGPWLPECDYHHGKQYENFAPPVMRLLRGASPEVLDGFAAMLGHAIALCADGFVPDADHIESLIETAWPT